MSKSLSYDKFNRYFHSIRKALNPNHNDSWHHPNFWEVIIPKENKKIFQMHQQVRKRRKKSFESNWDLKESHDLDYEKQLLKAMSSKAPRKAKAKSSNLRKFMELNSIRSWDCFRSHNIEGFLPVIFPFVQDSLTKYDSSYWSSS